MAGAAAVSARLPRWAHRLYARCRGYFWLPCPLCGTYFGGHEQITLAGSSGVVHVQDLGGGVWLGKVICPACTRQRAPRKHGNGGAS
jgi:hypothetical protein